MALRNLKSDLKDLSFGNGTAYDRPNQGFSREPFIKKRLNLGGDTGLNTLTGGFIRGGLLLHAERNLQDVARIGKFLITGRGITFLAKQVGLQKSNPKVSEPAFTISKANHRTYNLGINTLAQVAGQGTGLHVNRQGSTPLSKKGYADEDEFLSNYSIVAPTSRLTTDENTNRLLYLYNNHSIISSTGLNEPKTGLGKFFENVKKSFAKPGEELYSYNGGPGSTYGIGQTQIRKYSPNIPGFLKDKFDSHNDTTGEEGRVNPKIKNYLHTLGKIPEDNYNIKFENGSKTYHRESRVNLGNPGSKPDESTTTVDLINALDVFKSNDGGGLRNEIRDLIRFRIEAVNPLNPQQSNVMVFRAFLDSLNDNFNANYNEFTYNGRGENFYTYNGFNRDISFSFKIAAQSSREMKPLYRKLNYLLSNTAPEYNETSGRMMTPFMRLTMGAYFERLPGVIKNVGITWQKDYPWEITLNAPERGKDYTKGLLVLPHVLDVNVTYQPIHDFLPRKSIHSPFIIPHENSAIAKTAPGRKLWNSEKEAETIDEAVGKIEK